MALDGTIPCVAMAIQICGGVKSAGIFDEWTSAVAERKQYFVVHHVVTLIGIWCELQWAG